MRLISIKFFVLLVLIGFFSPIDLFPRISSRVEGTVIDKDTGQPIEGAEVHLLNIYLTSRPGYGKLFEWEKATDKKGKFKFEVRFSHIKVPQSYYLQCKKKGYISLIPDFYFEYYRDEKFPEMAGVFVMGEGEVKHFVIELEKGGTLKGTILKREASGVSTFSYVGGFLQRKANPNERYLRENHYYNIIDIDTDENGKFEIIGVEPFDDYFIKLVLDGYVDQVIENIKIEKNQSENIEYIIDLTNQTGIEGIIRIGQHFPKGGSILMYKLNTGSLVQSDICGCRLENDGSYICKGINPGTYRIKVTASDENDSYEKEFTVEILEGKTKNFDINL